MNDRESSDTLERRVDVGSVRLAVAEAGRGGRPLMLVHGFTGAKEDFADWMGPFAGAGFHVVAPDNRGHGDSDKPADESKYLDKFFVNDILGLADALGWSSFNLLGHSMGGMIAQILAIENPTRVERLVLMDTHHGALDGIEPEMAQMGMAVVRAQGIGALADLLAKGDALLTNPAHERLLREREGYAEFNDRKLRSCSGHMWVSVVEQLLDIPDRLADLARVKVPTLVLVGALDEPFLAASKRMAEVIPGARLDIIDDAGHSPQFEAPEQWWRSVVGFFGGR
ncbi:MAG: 2-hydroxymuconate semialdehyde hydrolase [Acidimicrobiales bacterium]|nr:MAG: alpha/beta hydrolase [Actinomycetota bacterium]MBV6508108.1 2-hydroxymuconate semialdehyde hydrolase [Acidimicrobiales bacterium]RIK03854.1 MAG: hypothetical protein DCC48_15185 [Acidobacteriota bacterium]